MSERVGRTVRGVVLSAVAGAAFATLAAPPARAQTAPRPVRVPLEPQFERLRRTIDSLDRLLATGNLSLAERRTVGSELDRRIAEFNQRRERTEGQGPSDVVIHLRSQMSRLQRGDGVLDDLSQSIMAQNAAPRGWVGIMVDGAPQERWVERGELFVRYFSYPRVLSVDPSSPAQRAGFIPNDELLAYNGRDLREEISLTRLLEPESRITIRFRREGRVRELPVTVVPEPLDIRRRREAFRTVRGPTAVARTFDVPPFERTSPPVPGTRPLAPGAPGAPGAPAPVTLSLPPRLAMAPTGVVGAQMVTLTDGLAKAIGQRGVRGVLVTDVPLGSPAFESGLRDGDIITRVGGRDIRTLTELRDRVGRAAENGEPAVEVDVMRERRAVKLILRW